MSSPLLAEDIELSITNITDGNRRAKFLRAIVELSRLMGLRPSVRAPWLAKAKTHKYLSRVWKDGRWEYEYPDDGKGNAPKTEAELPVISGVARARVDGGNYRQVAEAEFARLRAKIAEGLYCPALGGKKVVGAKEGHLDYPQGKWRGLKNIIARVSLMPCIIPIIEQGKKTGQRKNPSYKGNYHEISASTANRKKVSVVLADKGDGCLYISIIGKDLVKKAICSGSHPLPTVPERYSPSLHKSLPYRAASGEEFSPSPDDLSIPHVYAKSIREYLDLDLSISGISLANRKAKLAKAIRAVAGHLRVPVEVVRKDGGPVASGEPHAHPALAQLSGYWAGLYRALLEKAYAAVIEALGLPAATEETMRKSGNEPRELGRGVTGRRPVWGVAEDARGAAEARGACPPPSKWNPAMRKAGGSALLRYKGKIVYNPETGAPLENDDFDRLVESIQDFLNEGTKDWGKRVHLDSAAIARLLRRLARYGTVEEVRRLRLENMKYRGKSLDWIRADFRRLDDALGKPLSAREKATYQAASDYAASLVTRSNRKIRDEIKDTVLKGILQRRSRSQVSQDLFNAMGRLNRDWKRIADTEIVNAANLAGILEDAADARPGEKTYFMRVEFPGCCPHCAAANGKIALWSEAPLADERISDPHAKIAIWEGKTREQGIPVGTMHPNCRGTWTRWGGERVDAFVATAQGRGEKWNEAVEQAREEWRAKGERSPDDATPGYAARITALFREKTGDAEWEPPRAGHK